MARNKREIDREQKQTEIEQAASRLFLSQGYEATSMTAVATAAGVAPNTLYWYFRNKDELLIAVLNRLLAAGLAGQASLREKPLTEQLHWLVGQFEQAHRLVMTVHARLEQSGEVRVWHEQFHRLLDQLIVSALVERGMAAEEAATLATMGTFVIEGLLSHPHSPEQRRRVLDWLGQRAG